MMIILVLWEHPLGDERDVVVGKVNAFDAKAVLAKKILKIRLKLLDSKDVEINLIKQSQLTSNRPAVLFSNFSSLGKDKRFDQHHYYGPLKTWHNM